MEKAKVDEKLVLLSGDIGFGIFDDLISEKPERFINCGIAEQNMIGVAAGLAANGYRPFVYTIIPFLLMRPFEFIRNLIAHQNLPVVLVGVGGGFSYDNLGYTHYAKEDLVLASTLPNFEVYSPCDKFDAEYSFESALASSKPSYIRLMKGGEPIVLDRVPEKNVSVLANFGSQMTIVTHGGTASEAVKSANILNDLGIKIRVVTINNFTKPIAISKLCVGPIMLIEEQVKPGFLYDLVHEAQNNQSKVYTRYINKDSDNKFMDRADILKFHNLGCDSIVEYAKKILSQKRNN